MKKLLPIIGAGGAALVVSGLLFAWLMSGGIDTAGKLDLALRLLDEGRWDVAGRIARELEQQGRVDPETDASWHYAQGLSMLLAVRDDLDSPRNRRKLLVATEHLIKANEIGFPMGYNGKGKFYLGWCYFNTYRFEEVTQTLRDSEKLWPERRSDAFKMLVEAHLRKMPPDYAAADDRLAAWSEIPGMSLSEQARILLARAQYAFLMEQYPECESHLAEISVDTPEFVEGTLWRGRWRLEYAAQLPKENLARASMLEEAAAIIRQVMNSPTAPAHLRRQSAFLAGRILRNQDRMQEALGSFSTVRHSHPQSAEAITSSLEEAEILLEAGRLDDAVETCHLLLRNIEDVALYNGYWLPVSELRSRLLEIGRTLSRDRLYAQVIRLAGHLTLAFPPTDSVRLKAEAFLQWGDDLKEEQMGITRQEQVPLRSRAEKKYAAAAAQFEQLARLELKSSEYPEILWRAISAHQAANDLDSANRLLRDYLYYEEKSKRPRGFLALARNYMDAAKWKKAILPLQRCIDEYPGHAILYEARLLSSKAYTELDDLDKAADLLEENLFVNDLEPSSETWRDSMYNLGLTRFRQGKRLLLEADQHPRDGSKTTEILEQYAAGQARIFEALQHLGHASTRYRNQPRFFEARYTMAVAGRLAAHAYKALAEENDSIIESTRRQLLTDWRNRLTSSLSQYKVLRNEVSRNQEVFESSDQFNAIIRNCLFGEADTLFDLGEWEEAATAYRAAAGRYINQPESLEALVQLAHCHRKLGKPEDAKKTLNQAEQVLSRIPPEMDAQFVSLTRTNRPGWKDLLQWLKKWD